jgi:hypothetical protein
VPGESKLPATLASDAEREQSIVLLRDAVVGGRLTLAEFSDRVGRAQLARTEAELAELIADLPAQASVPAETERVKHSAVCAKLIRRGPWALPARSHWRSICGTIELDLRQARLVGPESELTIFNLCGTVVVIVPHGVEVTVDGGAPFASQVIDPPSQPPPPDAPRIRIHTSGPFGTLYVRPKPRPRGVAKAIEKLGLSDS